MTLFCSRILLAKRENFSFTRMDKICWKTGENNYEKRSCHFSCENFTGLLKRIDVYVRPVY
jgi:hypothetical protein